MSKFKTVSIIDFSITGINPYSDYITYLQAVREREREREESDISCTVILCVFSVFSPFSCQQNGLKFDDGSSC